jgi:hypothetical protein
MRPSPHPPTTAAASRILRVAAMLACCLTSAVAQDFHVDQAQGHDGADGTTPASAWASLGKVESTRLAPGDRVLFKRGDLWRARLRPRWDGAEGRPITFAAYGDPAAPKPRFTGSEALDAQRFAQQGTSRVYTCAHAAPVYALLVDGVFLFRHDPGAWERFAAEGKPWSFVWHDGVLSIKLYDPVVDAAKFSGLPAFAYQQPQSQGAWRAVVEDDLICSMAADGAPHHHLVFRDLVAEDSARLDDNGGYGVRIMGSEDVLLERVEVYRAGKHHFGCINSHRVVHRDCYAAWPHPGQDNGGNSAWVSFNGPDSPYPAGASEYWNCTYEHTEDTWSTLYNQYGTAHAFIMEMHGPKLGPVLMDHLVSRGGGWSLNNSEHPDARILVRGGLIEDARLVMQGRGIEIDGLRMTGPRATIDISGTGHLLQNLVITGTLTHGWDKDTAILCRSPGNTVRFSTIVTAAEAGGAQSCIATTAAGNAPACFADILIANGAVLDFADAPSACDHNLYRTGAVFAAGGRKDLAAWRKLGFDANAVIADDPRFVAPAAGDWRLQEGSPALGAAALPAARLPAHDADGTPRPQGKAADIGAYERPAAAKR